VETQLARFLSRVRASYARCRQFLQTPQKHRAFGPRVSGLLTFFPKRLARFLAKSSALSEVFALIVLVEKWGAVELSMGLIRDKWVLMRSTVPSLSPLRDVQFDAVFAAFSCRLR
jgi:hypothetical protein